MASQEGDLIVVRCEHCAAQSIALVLIEGASVQQCPKCSESTRFTVERDKSKTDWEIEAEAV